MYIYLYIYIYIYIFISAHRQAFLKLVGVLQVSNRIFRFFLQGFGGRGCGVDGILVIDRGLTEYREASSKLVGLTILAISCSRQIPPVRTPRWPLFIPNHKPQTPRAAYPGLKMTEYGSPGN